MTCIEWRPDAVIWIVMLERGRTNELTIWVWNGDQVSLGLINRWMRGWKIEGRHRYSWLQWKWVIVGNCIMGCVAYSFINRRLCGKCVGIWLMMELEGVIKDRIWVMTLHPTSTKRTAMFTTAPAGAHSVETGKLAADYMTWPWCFVNLNRRRTSGGRLKSLTWAIWHQEYVYYTPGYLIQWWALQPAEHHCHLCLRIGWPRERLACMSNVVGRARSPLEASTTGSSGWALNKISIPMLCR